MIGAIALYDRGLFPGLFGTLVSVSSAALIAGAAALERGRIWSLGPLTALGDASYTIYLTHVHIQAPLMRLLKPTGIDVDVLFVGVLGATVLAGYGLYLVIERPILRTLSGSRSGLQARLESVAQT